MILESPDLRLVLVQCLSVGKKDYFFSGPVIFIFWPSPRPGSAINRSGGFQRHIKTSRSVQNDAVVASGRHFECRNYPEVLIHSIFPVVLSNKGNLWLEQSKTTLRLQSDAPRQLLHRFGHFWMFLYVSGSRPIYWWHSQTTWMTRR